MRVCQIALQEANDEVRKLKIENATLKAAASSSSTASSRRDILTWLKSEHLVPHAKEIIKYAKKFVVLEELWPNENAFLKPCPVAPISIQERGKSTEAYISHITYLLYATAPLNFHGFLETLPAFKDGVSCFVLLIFYI